MEFINSPNFSSRNGKKIEYVVIHWFGVGTINGAIASFQNPSRQASAHYLVSDNRIVQMVDEKDCAWHCGNLNMNQRSIGIENDANPDKQLSEASYKTCGKLLREICDRYQIPLDREHIKGHKEIKPTQCPGTINIDKLIEIAKGSQEVNVDEREIARQVFCHTLNGYFNSIYGRAFADPIKQFENDFNYWYATHKLECAGQWVNNQPNEPEFKNNWVSATTVAKKINDATKPLQAEIDNLNEDLDEQAGLCDARINSEVKKAVKEACKNCQKTEVVYYESIIWNTIKAIFTKK